MNFRRLMLSGALVLSFQSFGQVKTSQVSVRSSLKKVIESFTKDFAPVRGTVIEKNPQTIEYASLVVPEGAKETSITEYTSSTDRHVYSWQAVWLRTDNFAEAAKLYKRLYDELKGLNITYVVDQYTLEGRYQAPDESKAFIVSEVTVSHPPAQLSKLKVEVQMQYELPEWKVSVAVFEREKSDAPMD